jgi:hypothetical protein
MQIFQWACFRNTSSIKEFFKCRITADNDSVSFICGESGEKAYNISASRDCFKKDCSLECRSDSWRCGYKRASCSGRLGM